jgi:tRNA pseudouridine synthase 10
MDTDSSDPRLERLLALAEREAAPCEFDRFAVGCHFGAAPPGAPLTLEQVAEKKRVIAAVAGLLARLRPAARAVNPGEAELMLTVSWPEPACERLLAPACLAGRYRKLSRFMPSARWPCRTCRGAGCPRCAGSGRMYRKTVEDVLAAAFLGPAGAEATRLHTCGREDVDARMLGPGRPFVLELLAPRRRRFPLEPVARALAGSRETAFEALHWTTRAAVPELYAARPWKRYEALVALEAPLRAAELPARLPREPITLEQQTPARVAHRRADRLRHRTVRITALRPAAELDHFDALPRGRQAEVRLFRLALRAEPGTYVKEFVSGDDGRTRPSVAALLGVPARCVLLDVTGLETA